MPRCQFSERQYEFCCNYELQSAYGAVLVGGMPAIPSQVEEAAEGYDAAYAAAGGVTLLLQYKVSHFAEKAWGTGASVYSAWGGPYFRARLHQGAGGVCAQHNTLVGLATPLVHPFYVAPCFHERPDLVSRFMGGAGSVLDNSLVAPVAGLPLLTDGKSHSITYPVGGSSFRLHSEPVGPFEAHSGVLAAVESASVVSWGPQYFRELRDTLRAVVAEHGWPSVQPSYEDEFENVLFEIEAIVQQRLGGVLALFPRET